jgi:hypothetical protein
MAVRVSRFAKDHVRAATEAGRAGHVTKLPPGSANAIPGVPAATTRGFRAGFIDIKRSSTQVVSVHAVDCSIAFTVIAHLYKSKPAGLSRFAIRYDIYPVNCAVSLKQRTDILLGRAETQIPDENVFH